MDLKSWPALPRLGRSANRTKSNPDTVPPEVPGEEAIEPAELAVNTRQIGRVTLVKLSGRLCLGRGTNQLRNSIQELIAAGHNQLLLELAEVSYVDSAGLGEVMASYKAAQRTGGQLKLLRLTKQIRELLRATKLDGVFTTFEDESAAVLSYE